MIIDYIETHNTILEEGRVMIGVPKEKEFKRNHVRCLGKLTFSMIVGSGPFCWVLSHINICGCWDSVSTPRKCSLSFIIVQQLVYPLLS